MPFSVLMIPSRFEIRDSDPYYQEVRTKMIKSLNQLKIDTIDTIKELKVVGFKPKHFTHDGHWSPLGHKIAGNAVAKWVLRQEL